jgi:hypothetical protein
MEETMKNIMTSAVALGAIFTLEMSQPAKAAYTQIDTSNIHLVRGGGGHHAGGGGAHHAGGGGAHHAGGFAHGGGHHHHGDGHWGGYGYGVGAVGVGIGLGVLGTEVVNEAPYGYSYPDTYIDYDGGYDGGYDPEAGYYEYN